MNEDKILVKRELEFASCCLLVGILLAFSGKDVMAQSNIIPDRTLGAESSRVIPDDGDSSVEQIQGGAQRGVNLFHSFNEFNIETGRSAYFTNPTGVENILSRVTGNNLSDIDGKLGVLGNANLFLINPNGILFGPNARLDLGGSFLASTADSFRFSDSHAFSAQNPQNPSLLSVNVPIGLQFGVQPRPITVQGSALAVDKGETLSLAGGGVELTDASLTALGGRVELGSVAEAGELWLNSEIGFEVPENIKRADIELSGSDLTVASDGGGDIGIFAKNLKLFAKSKLTAGIAEDEGFVQAQAGDIDLYATKGITIQRSSTVRNLVGEVELAAENEQAQAIGNGGNINIDTRTLTLRDGGEIRADTSGVGDAGIITIRARESVFAEGRVARPPDGPRVSGDFMQSGVFSNVNPQAQGNTGDVVVETSRLTLRSGSHIESSSFGAGDAGKIYIRARESVEVIGDDSNILSNVNSSIIFKEENRAVSGNVDGIDIETGALIAREGGRIRSGINKSDDVSEVIGKGSSGLVKIVAREFVLFEGEDSEGRRSGIFSVVQEGTTGIQNPGIEIDTGALTLRDGGQITSDTGGRGDAGDIALQARDFILLEGKGTKGASAISNTVDNGASGSAGNITIVTGALTVDGGQISSSTFGVGNAGQVKITASDLALIEGRNFEGEENPKQGILSRASDKSNGTAGGVSIEAKSLQIRDGAEVTVSSGGRAKGGDIELTSDSLTLDKGMISAETTSNLGGDIKLNISSLLSLKNSSQISASGGNNQAGGDGGNISIKTPILFAIPQENNDIKADAFKGQGGNIEVATQGIFGIAFREQESALTSDITASSEFGTEGTVDINTPETDLNSGLINLPVQPAETKVAKTCSPGGPQAQNEFVSTWRGGLPPTAQEALNNNIDVAWVNLNPHRAKTHASQATLEIEPRQKTKFYQRTRQSTPPRPIIEAQGWAKRSDGNLMLTASERPTQTNPSWNTANC